MIEFNVVYGILIALALVLIIRYALPYLKANGMKSDIYADMKLGLLMFGYAFRDEKVKEITALMVGIVSQIEQLDIAPVQKKEEALEIAFISLMDELNIILDPEALSTIINIAVAYLPKTKPVIE